MEPTDTEFRVIKACQTDDLQYFQQVLESELGKPSPNLDDARRAQALDAIFGLTLNHAVAQPAPQIMEYVLANGANVADVDVKGAPTSKFIDLVMVLLRYGYDINKPPGLLLSCARDETALEWALEHGAMITPENSPHLLKTAVVFGTLKTFKRLQSLGAPLDPNLLNIAVGRVGKPWSFESIEKAEEKTTEGMKIVRYLVDELHYDVNAQSERRPPPKTVMSKKWLGGTTPLWECVDAQEERSLQVVRFLLLRGADPTEALLKAEARERVTGQKRPFIPLVKAFQAEKSLSGLQI